MGLFSRKPKAAAVPAAQQVYHVGPPEPAKSPSGLVSYFPDGRIEISGNTIAQAKTVMAELRLHKRVLSEQKRELSTHERELRADYTDGVRHQGPVVHGSGTFAHVMRAGQEAGRRNTRANLANQIQPLEGRKREIDEQIATTERTILAVEGWILKQQAGSGTP